MLAKTNEVFAANPVPGPARATAHSVVQPLNTAGLAVQLTRFIEAPQDIKRERRFASMLLTAKFVALVQVRKVGKVGTDDIKTQMQIGLGVTRYMADGQRYIPVFTDEQMMTRFMESNAKNLDMRSFAFTSQELMAECKRLDAAGVLINPGKQSFPLTAEYWDYINQVVPLVEPDVQQLKLELLRVDRNKLTRSMTKRAKHIRGIKRLWATNVRLSTHSPSELAIIVDYKGTDEAFDKRYAKSLAVAARAVLELDQDVLVGTINDEVGAQIAAQCAPLYQAGSLFKRGAIYD